MVIVVCLAGWLKAKGKKYFDFMGLSNSGRENLLIAKNISLPLEEAARKISDAIVCKMLKHPWWDAFCGGV